MNNDPFNPAVTPASAVAIVADPANISMIMRSGPESFNRNKLSRDNCLLACGKLLDEIKSQGMNDELDKKTALYLNRVRVTLKDMNERRAPVTKLFDQIRKEFTVMENEIDPAKAGTIPYELQQQRNRYATRKREEEEARRKAEEARRAAELARANYADECKADFKSQFNDLVVRGINLLTDLNSRCTLESYQAVHDTLTGFEQELPADWNPQSKVRLPFNLSPDESRSICAEALRQLMPGFREQYATEIGDYRQEILDRLPSRKAEFERAAAASADEKAKIEAEVKAREAAELARKEQERIAREAEEARRKEAEKAAAEGAGLFAAAAATRTVYTPKAKVTKKLRIVSPEGYMQVLALWWAKEGCNLSEDELAKTFKKQITFCEKLANKDGQLIEHPSVQYVEEVKAQ
ncbi:MAG: hypothetical protein NC212_08660 [Staphylococcus sp.]|nr:hypothetical protein [Staphylococcus sp.]